MKPTLGRRLATYVLGLIILFFSINGYIQSYSNNQILHSDAHDRGILIDKIGELTRANNAQTNTIRGLRNALVKQNNTLSKLHLKTVNIPQIFINSHDETTSPVPISKPTPKSNPSPEKTPSQKPTERPTHHPGTNPPKPKPSPLQSLSGTLCGITGICLGKIDFKEPLCCGSRTVRLMTLQNSWLWYFFRPLVRYISL